MASMAASLCGGGGSVQLPKAAGSLWAARWKSKRTRAQSRKMAGSVAQAAFAEASSEPPRAAAAARDTRTQRRGGGAAPREAASRSSSVRRAAKRHVSRSARSTAAVTRGSLRLQSPKPHARKTSPRASTIARATSVARACANLGSSAPLRGSSPVKTSSSAGDGEAEAKRRAAARTGVKASAPRVCTTSSAATKAASAVVGSTSDVSCALWDAKTPRTIPDAVGNTAGLRDNRST
mmetsp:Transcript_10516/g.31692  ORF Transcript_10516/g.31692 Transcript_10516/m.31692 type:complete len:236 (+) Transcript_10516:521-1228(+)